MTRSLRIAVADDECDTRDYFSKLLTRWGHQVVAVAANGRELVEACRDSLPDLVITDVRMPEMDGLAAAAEICRRRPVPVVFVSALHPPTSPDLPRHVRILSWVAKPVGPADLLPLLEQVAGLADTPRSPPADGEE